MLETMASNARSHSINHIHTPYSTLHSNPRESHSTLHFYKLTTAYCTTTFHTLQCTTATRTPNFTDLVCKQKSDQKKVGSHTTTVWCLPPNQHPRDECGAGELAGATTPAAFLVVPLCNNHRYRYYVCVYFSDSCGLERKRTTMFHSPEN
jgi:hypothetical protein